MLLLYLELAIAHITLIASAGGVAAPGFESRTPCEALARVDVALQRGIGEDGILLGGGATAVRTDVVGSQLAVARVGHDAKGIDILIEMDGTIVCDQVNRVGRLVQMGQRGVGRL